LLSVVVPVRGRPELLVEQLEALSAQVGADPWELIVADDSDPGDDSIADVLARFEGRIPGLRRVPAGGQGAAHARNVGAAFAAGDKLGFLDADDVAAPGWVAALSAALDEHEVVASRWEFELLNPPEVLASRAPAQVDGLQRYTRPAYLDHAGGCGLGIRRELFEAMSGFDESWPLLEDTDLCWRLQLAGHRIAFAPDAVVHIRFRSGAASFWQAYGYGFYNVRLYKEYVPRGMPRLGPLKSLRSLWGLVLTAPEALRKGSRARYMRRLGFRLGRLAGSFRFGVWAV
jgi:GT2 family glycosyltransferase